MVYIYPALSSHSDVADAVRSSQRTNVMYLVYVRGCTEVLDHLGDPSDTMDVDIPGVQQDIAQLLDIPVIVDGQ